MSKQKHGRCRCPPGFVVDQIPPVMRGPQSVGRHPSLLPREHEGRLVFLLMLMKLVSVMMMMMMMLLKMTNDLQKFLEKSVFISA